MRSVFCAILTLSMTGLGAGLTGCHKADDYDSHYDKVAQDIEARQRAIEEGIGKESQPPDVPNGKSK